MAVAKAQYAISEITALLRAKGVNVRVSGDPTYKRQFIDKTAVCDSPCSWSYAWTM